MSINLKIPGDPDGLHSLADWLDPKIKAPTASLTDGLAQLIWDTPMFWRGESASAFQLAAKNVRIGVEPLGSYAADAAETIRAYARRLSRGRQTFAGYADIAYQNWLTVVGSIIEPPVAPTQFAAPAGTPRPTERGPNGECLSPLPVGGYEDSVLCYQKLDKSVSKWWAELRAWVDDHFAPLIARAVEFEGLSVTFDALQHGNELVRGIYLEDAGSKWKDTLSAAEQAADSAQEAFNRLERQMISGSPEFRAAAARFTSPELREARSLLDAEVGRLRVGTRIIPVAGVAIDVVSAAADVAAGGSVSSTGIGLAGGFVGGLGAGAWLAPVLGAVLPPVAVIAVVSGISVAAGSAASWAWEASAPLDLREAIDAGDFGYVFARS